MICTRAGHHFVKNDARDMADTLENLGVKIR